MKNKKEIPVIFHNGSTYDYHLIIKPIAKEFKGHFECLGENTEKYVTFSVPIAKEVNGGENDENDDGKNVCDNGTTQEKRKPLTYRLKFIDSCRFMRDSL